MKQVFFSLSKRWINSIQAVIFSSLFTLSASANEPISQPKERFATLDWTIAETLTALGEKPIIVGDAKDYNRWVKDASLPKHIQDLEIHLEANPTQIGRISSSLKGKSFTFINSSLYAQATPLLKKQAQKVEVIRFFHEGDAWINIINATKRISEIIHKPEAFEILLTQYSHTINKISPLMEPYLSRPVALVQFIDSSHLRIYAQNSHFGSVLKQLGFKNAWQGSYNHWGFETIEVSQLSQLDKNSRIVVIKPYPSNVAMAMKYNVLWQKLDMARDPLVLPEIWTLGGIPSAQRFAEAFAHALIYGGETW